MRRERVVRRMQRAIGVRVGLSTATESIGPTTRVLGCVVVLAFGCGGRPPAPTERASTVDVNGKRPPRLGMERPSPGLAIDLSWKDDSLHVRPLMCEDGRLPMFVYSVDVVFRGELICFISTNPGGPPAAALSEWHYGDVPRGYQGRCGPLPRGEVLGIRVDGEGLGDAAFSVDAAGRIGVHRRSCPKHFGGMPDLTPPPQAPSTDGPDASLESGVTPNRAPSAAPAPGASTLVGGTQP